MKKIFFVLLVGAFAFFGGFAAGSGGWCLAFKHRAGFHHIYTDTDENALSHHYSFILLGYDARGHSLFAWREI